jgi:hypothetical protein
VTAEQPAFDPVAFKKTIRQGWDAVAEAWDRWTPVLGAWFGPVTKPCWTWPASERAIRSSTWRAGAGEPGLTAPARVG